MIRENETLFDQLKTQAVAQVLETEKQSEPEVFSTRFRIIKAGSKENHFYSLPFGQKNVRKKFYKFEPWVCMHNDCPPLWVH